MVVALVVVEVAKVSLIAMDSIVICVSSMATICYHQFDPSFTLLVGYGCDYLNQGNYQNQDNGFNGFGNGFVN